MSFQLRTRNGFDMYEVTSSLQKTIRRGLEDEAIYWSIELEQKFYNHLWNRLVIISSEDIGTADNSIAVLVSNLRINYLEARKKDKGERFLFLFHAVQAMCRAKKNRDADETAHHYYIKHIINGEALDIPDYAFDKHTLKGKRMGRDTIHFWSEGVQVSNDVSEHKHLKFIQDFYKENPDNKIDLS